MFPHLFILTAYHREQVGIISLIIMKYLLIISLVIAFVSCGNSNKTVNSEDTETVNGYRYEKGSDEAFTGTVKFKNGTTKEYKDGKVISRTIYHENGQPASTKYKDENGRYYKKVEYDKAGNKIDEKVYE